MNPRASILLTCFLLISLVLAYGSIKSAGVPTVADLNISTDENTTLIFENEYNTLSDRRFAEDLNISADLNATMAYVLFNASSLADLNASLDVNQTIYFISESNLADLNVSLDKNATIAFGNWIARR